MHMILSYTPLHDRYIPTYACLPYQFSRPQRYFTFQNLIPVFCYPYQVILDVIDRMSPVLVFHITILPWFSR